MAERIPEAPCLASGYPARVTPPAPHDPRLDKLDAARWPSREDAAKSRLFSPIAIGTTRLETRTWVPAMVPWRCTEEGFVTPDILEWYGRFAEGRPGALVVEATGIRDVPSGPLMRIGHDRFLPGLRDLVNVVHERSGGATKIFIQLIDFLVVRRRPERSKFLARFLMLDEGHRERLHSQGHAVDGADESALREALVALDDDQLQEILTEREWDDLQRGYRERVNDMHLDHVRDLPATLPGLFAEAAARAKDAGFDGVELHYAHAYTMASFLSARNDRDDGYGGSRENRVRLPLEVYAAVRDRVGADYPVGCRLLGDEVIEGGSRIDDAAYYSVELARAGMDFISVSKGGKFEDAKQPKVGHAIYPYTGPSGHECMPTVRIEGGSPFGRNLPLSARIRADVRAKGLETPVVGAGGINSFELAENALQAGDCDIIASARQSLADPDWFEKMRLGEGAAIRRCIFTNYCEGLDQKHLQVTCQLWDRDYDAPGCTDRSHDGKRRLVAPNWERTDEPLD